MATAPQIRAIYALGSKLGINQNNREDNLHQLVYSITGKESIKGLTNYEAARVQSELANMERKVHAADIPPGKMTAEQQNYVKYLIFRLQKLSPSNAPYGERMRGAVKKIIDMDINPYSNPLYNEFQRKYIIYKSIMRKAFVNWIYRNLMDDE